MFDPDESIPDFAGARDHVIAQLLRFERSLRAAGADVHAIAAVDGAAALAEVGLRDRSRVESALRATLLHSSTDDDLFDEHFPAFWYRLRSGLEATIAQPDAGPGDDESTGTKVRTVSDSAADFRPGSDGESTAEGSDGREFERRSAGDDVLESEDPMETDEDTRMATYSATGEGSTLTDEPGGVAIEERDLRRFEQALATLSGRRWTAEPSGPRVDARRALRQSFTTGGVAMTLPRRAGKPTAFRCCLLVDVSQSVLDAVDRGFLVELVARLQADSRAGRTFFFDTAIREVTDAIATTDGDPMGALQRAELEWGGGTQIGDALAELRRSSPTAVDRRTVTIVVSDGLDVGDQDDLQRGMAWLARRSRAVLWLNPLASSNAYEPTCRGMATALPYVDGLFALGDSRDLVDIARQLEHRGYTRVGYEHDFRERADSE